MRTLRVMTMNKQHFLIIICATILSLFIASLHTKYISDESILGFLSASPMLIGILLASVLTSLAIILAIIGSSEMIRIRELESKQNKAYFGKISRNMRQNVYFILISFIISSLLSILYIKECFSFTIADVSYSFEIHRILFALIAPLFITSCIATSDIINGLFDIFEFKYDLANQEKH